jgi:hypothetical protein
MGKLLEAAYEKTFEREQDSYPSAVQGPLGQIPMTSVCGVPRIITFTRLGFGWTTNAPESQPNGLCGNSQGRSVRTCPP